MEWQHYSELKDSLCVGDVLVVSFRRPESPNRMTGICFVGNDGALINIHSGEKIGVDPDVAFALSNPDHLLMKYWL